MGDRITFRERTEGVCVPVFMGASIMEPRVKYVRAYKKDEDLEGFDDPEEIERCGPDTPYRLKVSLSELEQMFYRARRSGFVAGEFRGPMPSPEEIENGAKQQFLNLVPETPPENNIATDNPSSGKWTSVSRGFFRRTDTGNPNSPNPSPYVLSQINEKFGDEYAVDNFFASWTPLYRDLEKESGMWLMLNVAAPMFSGANGITAFYSTRGGGPSAGLPGVSKTDEYGGDAFASLSNTVAYYVTENGSDDPFDPENELWVFLEIKFQDEEGLAGDPVLVSHPEIFFNEWVGDEFDPSQFTKIEDAFELELSGATVLTMDLYLYDNPGGGNSVSTMITPLRLKIEKYWPYAHLNGSPVWNKDTGAYIPEDTGE